MEHIRKVVQTSVRLDMVDLEELQGLYPHLTQSQLIRSAIKYMIGKKPSLQIERESIQFVEEAKRAS